MSALLMMEDLAKVAHIDPLATPSAPVEVLIFGVSADPMSHDLSGPDHDFSSSMCDAGVNVQAGRGRSPAIITGHDPDQGGRGGDHHHP